MSEGKTEVEEEGEFRLDSEDDSERDLGKVLTKSEASECLACVGRTFRIVDGVRTFAYPAFAYIAMEVIERNISDISVIPSFVHVIYLNLSNNRLTDESLAVLREMPQLKVLILDNNRIDCVSSLPELNNLQLLSVKGNNLTTCEVREFENLLYLDLSYNRIEKILPYLWCPLVLPKLTELSMRGNGLKKVAGFLFPTLVSLFLGENEITKIEGLELLPQLKFLHLRKNPLKYLDGISSENKNLFYLNIRDCQIESEKELKKLRDLPRLGRIVVVGNPFWEAENSRLKVIRILPTLRRINKKHVEEPEKQEAAAMDYDPDDGAADDEKYED